MSLACDEAFFALEKDEVPVGAVMVFENRVIGRGHNQMKSLNDPTAHAEILAISAAANTLRNERLTGATLYVTLEPCVMCSGALVLARIEHLVYGASDPKTGAAGSLYMVPQDERLNHRVNITQGILETRCSLLLKEFFERKRSQAGS